jgi:hypothetical protein
MTSTKTDKVALIPTTPAEVSKAIVYIGLTALGILAVALKAGELTGVTYLTIALAVVTLVPVYVLSGTAVKTAVAFISAGLQAVILLLGDGVAFSEIQPADYIGVLFTAFAAIGVLVVPNKPLGKPTPVAAVTPEVRIAADDVHTEPVVSGVQVPSVRYRGDSVIQGDSSTPTP